MVAIYDRAKREANYSATRFVQMVASQGGLKTARQLLHADNVSDGFTSLWEAGRLDRAFSIRASCSCIATPPAIPGSVEARPAMLPGSTKQAHTMKKGPVRSGAQSPQVLRLHSADAY